MKLTIIDHYRQERDEAANKDERKIVWRTYARAMLWEMDRRSLGGGIVWRKSRVDEGLAIPWLPYWAKISDEDLYELQETLIRARFRG